jgi:hypothetical protein
MAFLVSVSYARRFLCPVFYSSHVPFFAYHLKNQWNHLKSQCLDWLKKHLYHGQKQHVLAVWQRQQWRSSSSSSLGSRGRPFGGQH